MRRYANADRKEEVAVICNQCKKELKVENGIVKEGCFQGEAQFGYFSKKDGRKYSFDLCEDCFDKMLKGFLIPAEETEITEYL